MANLMKRYAEHVGDYHYSAYWRSWSEVVSYDDATDCVTERTVDDTRLRTHKTTPGKSDRFVTAEAFRTIQATA